MHKLCTFLCRFVRYSCRVCEFRMIDMNTRMLVSLLQPFEMRPAPRRRRQQKSMPAITTNCAIVCPSDGLKELRI